MKKAVVAAVVLIASVSLAVMALAPQKPAAQCPGDPSAAVPGQVMVCDGHTLFFDEDGRWHGTGYLAGRDGSPLPGPRVGFHCQRLLSEDLPSSVDNSAGLPPIGDQGQQGSCSAWASVYYLKTYYEGKEHGWALNDPAHWFSPAFTYNQVHGIPGGSLFSDHFVIMQTFGAATIDLMPYNDQDESTWPSEAAYKEAMQYRIGTAYYLELSKTEDMLAAKSLLASGSILCTGLIIYGNFGHLSDYNYNYCLSNITGSPLAGHSVAIVGYDDNRQTCDGVGAFRIVNEWGPSWGDHGFFWASYQLMADPNKKAVNEVCHFDELAPDAPPDYAARFSLAYPRFRALEQKIGIGQPSSPANSVRLFNLYCFQGNNQKYDIPAPPNPIWVSLDLLGTIPDGANIFVSEKDIDPSNQLSGQIGLFSIVRMADGETLSSTQPPVAISATGSLASASVTLAWPPLLVGTAFADVTSGSSPLTVHFQAGASGGTPSYVYHWDFGDGQISTEQNPEHTYTSIGTMQAKLTLSDASDGEVTDGLAVSVLTPPPVISSMKKAGNPFRIKVAGSNLQNSIKVFIEGSEWTQVSWQSTTAITLTGGKSLKTAVPKNTTKHFRFLNPDGGEVTVTWQWP